MIGKSYDGTLANGVASTGVQGLETIVPIAGISGWYNYSRMNGVNLQVNEQPWLSDYVDTDPPAKCAAVRARLGEDEEDETGNYNDYWKTTDYRDGTIGDAGKVRASIFAYHGVNDLNVKDDNFALWWKALAKRGVERKVWLSQRGHVDPFDIRRDDWVETLHKWFDHELLNVRNRVMAEPRADIEVGPDQWITQEDWPSPAAAAVTLRPAADGSLGPGQAPEGATATFTDAPGSGRTGTPEGQMVSDPGTAKPFRSAFVSAPLPETARLSGTPAASLRIKLDKPTANLTALLVDYGDDTRVDYLGAGAGIKTLTTEDCHGESIPADDACYKKTQVATVRSAVNIVARGWLDAQNAQSLSDPKPLEPGRYYDVRWETLSQEYVLKQGHRLGLILAGTDSDYNTETATGAKVTVDLHGSSVSVPLVAGKRHHGGSALVPEAVAPWRGPSGVTLPVQERRFH
jgi:X-Pro dipeptidyl-peptidase